MKRYLVFSVCFLTVYAILQIGIGMILTMQYSPNIDDNWNHFGHHYMGEHSRRHMMVPTTRGAYFLSGIITPFLSASLAYYVSTKFPKVKE